MMETLVVIDFETTGFSPGAGARATEVGAVAVQGQKIVGRYQSLMNSATQVPSDVTRLTGITNEMVRSAPPATQVLKKLSNFIGSSQLVAHNASFDRQFLNRECELAGISVSRDFVCTMLLSRRVFPNMPNHKLETLADNLKLSISGSMHRALADAELTAGLLFKIQNVLSIGYDLSLPSHELLRRIQKADYTDVGRILTTQRIAERKQISSSNINHICG